MDTKTYEVKIKALKTAPSVDVGLSVLRQGKIIAKKGKFFEADMSIVLTNENHRLYRMLGTEYTGADSFSEQLKVEPGTTKLDGVFQDFSRAKTIESASNLSISEVTTIERAFYLCHSLESVDVSAWNISSVTNMIEVFSYCGLKTVDLSNWDTSNVETFMGMFEGCSDIESIIGVIDLGGCKNELPEGHEPINKYSPIKNMFAYCDKLKQVKIKNPPAGFTTHDPSTGLNEAGLRADQYEIVQ